jgi:DNA-binding transcriptional LysR family regulator
LTAAATERGSPKLAERYWCRVVLSWRGVASWIEPEIRVVVDGIFPMAPVIEAMRRFGEERTPTQLRLMTEYLGGVVERFEADEAVLMLTLEQHDDASYVATPLPRLEMLLVAHRDHPVHAIVAPVPRHELRSFVEIVVADSASQPRQRSSGLLFEAEQMLALSDFQSKREALRSGLGFGWLPRHLAAELLECGELRAIELEEGDVFAFNPYLVHRRDELPGRGARLFRKLLLGGMGGG